MIEQLIEQVAVHVRAAWPEVRAVYTRIPGDHVPERPYGLVLVGSAQASDAGTIVSTMYDIDVQIFGVWDEALEDKWAKAIELRRLLLAGPTYADLMLPSVRGMEFDGARTAAASSGLRHGDALVLDFRVVAELCG